MKWFKNINSVESLKKQYKKLCKQYHPDLNRDTDTTKIMQEINNEYEDLFNKYKNIHENDKGETYTAKEETKEQSADFINIINSIISFNIDIEIIGSWVWCFNSYEYREQLKALGFKYAAKKKAWLPPCYGKKAYKDMNAEEKAVVDSFQGEKAYNEILTKSNYYLAPVTNNQMLSLNEQN